MLAHHGFGVACIKFIVAIKIFGSRMPAYARLPRFRRRMERKNVDADGAANAFKKKHRVVLLVDSMLFHRYASAIRYQCDGHLLDFAVVEASLYKRTNQAAGLLLSSGGFYL